MHIDIRSLFQNPPLDTKVVVKGWVRNRRGNAYVTFISLNDGSTIHNLQIVAEAQDFAEQLIKQCTVGACLEVRGWFVKSQGKEQPFEVKAQEILILGHADAEKYPIQPKPHSFEFLREQAHLRMRTTTFGAVFRVRHHLAFAIHKFFNDRGFFYLHSPIITASDAEGAGELFKVTTLNLENPPRTAEGKIDFKQDFFGKEANLTVSGQLEAELAALALGKVYTFGPTFRAENSNTTRHLAEFWMIEPEMAFYDIHDNMNLAEEFLKYLIQYALTHCPDDLAFLDKRYAEEENKKKKEERSEMGLLEKLNFVLEHQFERLTYTEAIQILLDSPAHKKKKFQYEVAWGIDLQSEHERYLVEKYFKKPVILTNYPRKIKAFYMKQNEGEDVGKETVRAMDILFPGVGEIVGGSQREENYEKLLTRMKEVGINPEAMWWYLETRLFGTAPHSGFGLGFERLIQFVTGMNNIRDVIPFPRTPQNIEF
ncbi:MAG: asparagine--tRNA ligase [Microscillaceae bacterium]|nr:asparagine--tRNA ligase [Microscillaceae bacterium]MDW8461282.1 asparagine--tRNA ligase [Cytophagales bacterium]